MKTRSSLQRKFFFILLKRLTVIFIENLSVWILGCQTCTKSSLSLTSIFNVKLSELCWFPFFFHFKMDDIKFLGKKKLFMQKFAKKCLMVFNMSLCHWRLIANKFVISSTFFIRSKTYKTTCNLSVC